VSGGEGNDVVNGDAGNDELIGEEGNDSLNGGVGNDLLRSDLGNDTINGGSGFDYYRADYSDRSSGLTMTYDPVSGNGTITIGSEIDTLISIESFNTGQGLSGGFTGTNFNDVIIGTSDSESLGGIYGLFGLAGDDTISGGAGDDKVSGGEGNDVVNGDAGNDELIGEEGNDTLQGTNNGIGEQDYLVGGTGNDRFILADTTKTFYDDGNSTLPGDNDYATIADFSTTDDIIQLRGASSDYLLTVSGSNTNLYINKPGSEPDELIANISNQTALSLTASYFSYVSSPTLPSITLAVSPASVTEDGTANLIYTFTRTGSTTSALTANYTVGGTATNGTDYASIPTSVTFAANSATATVTVDPTADTTVESDETVILTLAAGTGYTVGTTTAVTGTITNVPATSVTPIEAFGNTKLVQDATNKLYAQIGNNNPIAIKNGATHITTNTYPGWQILAAETVNGINQVLLRNTSQNLLYIWNLDSNWSWQSSQGGWGLNSTQAFSQETNFQQDFNGDGFIGQPTTLPSITLTVSPASVTEDGTANLIYTFTRTGSTTSALTANYTVGGTATFSTDYTQTGAATFTSTTGTVNFLAGSSTATVTVDPTADTTVESDETVALTLATGTGYTVGTTTAVTGTITNVPATIVTPIEAFGNTKLVQDATNKLYAQIGNNNPTVIKNGATQITTNTYPGWQILAAETVNGINQVLLRNTSQNLLYIWNLDSNWSWQSSQGGWGLNSTQAFSQETNFQQDFNGDGIIGQPSTTLPSITLTVSPASVTEDGTANLIYTFTRTGSTTSALTANYTVGGTATFSTDYTQTGAASYTATTGTVTFAAGSSTATVTVDPTADTTVESDETVALTLASGTGYTVGTTTAVTGTITNVPATIVTPIEAFGNTKLVQDATNKLYAQIGNNNPTVIKNGATQITTNTYPGWQILAAETVNGINQVLL
ncbi:Calx-beta domain-containing protein, partial [Microcystis aeruginosa]|uniref:Calx-beta domain-containing protein n=2 Tax=Microcystis aeruginosa TaxID=1126 RepID=UPI003529EA8A